MNRGVVYSCTEGSIMGCSENYLRVEFGYIGETPLKVEG